MQRISVGLETRTLQRLYSGPSMPNDVRPHHWFSLHTATRSFDFGAVPESGDENEAVVLWVLTLQDIRRLHPDWLVRREVTFKDVCTGALLRIILSVSHRWETPIDPDPDGKQFSVLKQRLGALPEVELVWIECVKCAS